MPSGQRKTAHFERKREGKKERGKNSKEGEIKDADLVFLNLQVCLASDSRHMSRRDCKVGPYPLWDPWLW